MPSQDMESDWSKSPQQSWPAATARQLLLLLMSETKHAAVYQPCWLRQATENTASFWLCADGKSSAQTNVRTIVWAVSKHPPASNCFHSGRIHSFVPPPFIWGTSKGGALKSEWYIWKKCCPSNGSKAAGSLTAGPLSYGFCTVSTLMLLWHLLTPLEIWNTFQFLSSLQFSGQALIFGRQRFSRGGKKDGGRHR